MNSGDRENSGNREKEQPVEYRHKDGSLRARGQARGKHASGYWQWYRRDGSLLRSGHFRDGIQVGEWTTYDSSGEPYKVTDMKDGNPGAPRTELEL